MVERIEESIPAADVPRKFNKFFFITGDPKENQLGGIWINQLEYMRLVTTREFNDVTQVRLTSEDGKEFAEIAVKPTEFKVGNGDTLVALLPSARLRFAVGNVQVTRREIQAGIVPEAQSAVV